MNCATGNFLYTSKVATGTSSVKHFYKIHHSTEHTTFLLGNVQNNGLEQNIRDNWTVLLLEAFVKFRFLTPEKFAALRALKKVSEHSASSVDRVEKNGVAQNVRLD